MKIFLNRAIHSYVSNIFAYFYCYQKTTYSNDGYIGLTSLSKNFDPKKEQGGPPHRPGATARVEI